MSLWLVVACTLTQADAGFRWEVPPGGHAVTEPTGEVEAGGVPTRLRTLWARGEALEVGRFYADSFTRQGLYVAAGQRYDVAVTGFDPRSMRSYSAVLRQVKQGQVHVLLGEAHLAPSRARDASEVGPLFPGAQDALVTRDEGFAAVTYRAPASPAEVDAFYRATLAGYREVEPRTFEGAVQYSLHYLKGDPDAGTTVRLERRARPPP